MDKSINSQTTSIIMKTNHSPLELALTIIIPILIALGTAYFIHESLFGPSTTGIVLLMLILFTGNNLLCGSAAGALVFAGLVEIGLQRSSLVGLFFVLAALMFGLPRLTRAFWGD